MKLDRTQEEMNEFLNTAKKIGLKIEEAEPINLELNQFPIFYLPDWPDKIPSLKVHLGLKRSRFLEKNSETNIYHLRKKIVAIAITINARDSKGGIKVECRNPLDMTNSVELDSFSKSPIERLNCFLLFSQNIKKGAPKINKLAGQLLKQASSEVSDLAQAIAKATRSLEPFIPFLVADQLTQELEK